MKSLRSSHNCCCFSLSVQTMIRRFVVVLLASCCAGQLRGQSDSSGFALFPNNLGFTPLRANREEARMGIEQEIGSSRMTVAIGATMDLVQYTAGSATIRWGADFFSYSLAATVEDVRLKIAAADGFFGMHFSFTNDSPWSFRFRALHFSAHLVDGNYDIEANTWRDGHEPIAFSRNYGELVTAYSWNPGGISLRLYAGIILAVYNKPNDIKDWAGLAGFDLHTGGSPVVYLAGNVSALGIPAYGGRTTVEAGLKFGSWDARGVRVYVAYETGLVAFGEYYNERKD